MRVPPTRASHTRAPSDRELALPERPIFFAPSDLDCRKRAGVWGCLMLTTTIRKWLPPGPVALRAWASREPVVALQGPVGSGKTGTFVAKAQHGVTLQNKWPDGVKRARLCILRDDYRKLWENFIPSWLEWVPETLTDREGRPVIEWVGSHGGPAVQTIRTAVKDATAESGIGTCELEVHFLALGDNQSEEALEAFFSGLVFTWYWMNEGQTFKRAVFDYCIQRIGRYPHERDAKPVAAAVWLDFNAPIEGHFLHDMIINRELVANRHYFRQPGGLEPDAENQKGHPRERYERMMTWMRKHEVERKVHNKFGRKRDGEPVYDTFDDDRFVSPHELQPVLGRRLIIGLDQGLSPAASIRQRMADGQWRLLDEVICEHGVGPERFGRRLGVLLDSKKYIAFRGQGQIRAVADPAGFGGVDKTTNEQDWAARVAAEAGIRIVPAKTNNPKTRRQAVEDSLVVIEGVPMFLMSPTCVTGRRAMNGGYRWRKVRFAGEERLAEEPDKNEFSHWADGDQYAAMEEGGYEAAVGRETNESNPVMDRARAAGYAVSDGGRLRGISARRARLEGGQHRLAPLISGEDE